MACAPPLSAQAGCMTLTEARQERHDDRYRNPVLRTSRDPVMTVHEPLASLREVIAAARAEAGSLLACLRHTAGLSQVQLARRVGYSATVVAHAELGRRPVSAGFWALADEVLGAGGSLAAWGTRIKDLTRARREEQHRQDTAGRARQLSRFQPRPGAHDLTAAAPAAPGPAITAPAIGSCPHCHQPVMLVTQITEPPGTRPMPQSGLTG
jgi:transcriptional regulator with XRE-family HTH domain